MTMEIFNMEQGSDEWYAAKLGIPSASMFSAILAKGQGKTRRTYMYKLAGERITGQPMANHTTPHMERGKEMEAEARDFYEFTKGVEVERVGFIKNHGVGCSPDGLVGNNGLLEIKTAFPHILIEHLEIGRVPREHIPQLQGQIWEAEREWNDLLIYWPAVPPFLARVERDDEYIDRVLAPAVTYFRDELDALVKRLRDTPMAETYSAEPPVDLSTSPPAF